MLRRNLCLFLVLLFTSISGTSATAFAVTEETLKSVVSVLPVWPGHAQGGKGAPPGRAPEGSGVVVESGLIVTAFHVVEPAGRIDIRLSDGRVVQAKLVAGDKASDIAVLSTDADLQPIEFGRALRLAQPVCAIGNAFGLGLSVTCGVVSALGVTNAGFNGVEDFIQTDAAANPGTSGGALVDADGRLVGMISAIFASGSDTDIGVNFAVSRQLLQRVVPALIANGKVEYPAPGWHLEFAGREQLTRIAAPVIGSIRQDSPAELAGLEPGDLVVEIGTRLVRAPRDANTALALVPEDETSVQVKFQRDGQSRTADLTFKSPAPGAGLAASKEPAGSADCPHPMVVCVVRQAVFPISSFDPVGSATRIAPDLLVTNRHVVGDKPDAIVHTPGGPKQARVLPSAYQGDLALLEVEGLPDGGYLPDLQHQSPAGDRFYAVGADIARREVRVFDPGDLIAKPAEGAALGRLHVDARMQPGVSGGALVDASGNLVGIAVGGGDGRFEAIPLSGIEALLDLRLADEAEDVTEKLGAGFAACARIIDAVTAGSREPETLQDLAKTCSASTNHGQLLEAGRLLAQTGSFEDAILLHGQAADQVPNSINSRMSLLVSLQLAARFEDMTEHARWLMEAAPDDPQALRFSIQSGVWGNDPELAEEGYQALLKADPRQAQAARRFIDNAPPAPARR